MADETRKSIEDPELDAELTDDELEDVAGGVGRTGHAPREPTNILATSQKMQRLAGSIADANAAHLQGRMEPTRPTTSSRE